MKRTRSRSLLIAFALIQLLCLLSVSVHAETSANQTDLAGEIRATEASVLLGEDFDTELYYTGDAELFSARLFFGYDSDSVNINDILVTEGYSASMISGEGEFAYGILLMANDAQDAISDGKLMTVKANVSGTAKLGTLLFYLSDVYCEFKDENGDTLDITLQGSEIKVYCEHKTTETIVDKEATCSAEGASHTSCKICGELLESGTVIPKAPHGFGEWNVITEASCTVNGQREHVCLVCNEKETEEITAPGHTLSEWTTVKAATCIVTGERVIVCLKCFTTISTGEIPLAPHSFGEWVVVSEATNTSEGEKKRVCSVCSATEYETIPSIGAAHIHSYTGKETVIRAATCTEAGEMTVSCKYESCDSKTISIIPATGHQNLEKTLIKEATCSSAGSSEVRCADCGTLIRTEVVARLNHSYGRWNTVSEPTCAEKGVQECKCSVCGYTITRETDSFGHTSGEWSVTVKPTCTEAGEKQRLCTVCNEVMEKETINPTGHKDAVWTVIREATCTVSGERRGVCPDCGATLSEQISTASGHLFGAWSVSSLPSADADGQKTRSCSKCELIDVAAIKLYRVSSQSTGLVVEFTGDEGISPAFSADDITEEYRSDGRLDDIKASVSAIYRNAGVAALFDLSLEGAGDTSLTDSIRVLLPVSRIDDDFVELSVFSIDENGVNAVPTSKNGDYITFSVSHFSVYAVCGVKLDGDELPSEPEFSIDKMDFAVIICVILLLLEVTLGIFLLRNRKKRLKGISFTDNDDDYEGYEEPDSGQEAPRIVRAPIPTDYFDEDEEPDDEELEKLRIDDRDSSERASSATAAKPRVAASDTDDDDDDDEGVKIDIDGSGDKNDGAGDK